MPRNRRKTNQKYISVSVRMTESEHAVLKACAESRKKPMSTYMRNALLFYATREDPKSTNAALNNVFKRILKPPSS